MKRLFLLFAIIFYNSLSAFPAKNTLSVMDLSASGVTLEEAKTLTYRLIAELDKLQDKSWFTLVATEKREKILKEWAFQQTGTCDQATCIAKFGKALGVRQMIGGNVGKIGNTYSITFILVNVTSVKVEKTAVKDYKGEVDGLLDIISSLAAEITRKEVKEDETKEQTSTQPQQISSPEITPSGLTYLGKNVRGYEEYRNVKDGTILIQIPAGVFTMGYEEPRKAKVDTLIYKGKIMQIKKQGGLNVKHKVDLNTFFIGKYEITNAQYKLFCDQTEHSYPPDPKFKGMAQYFVNYPNYPVVNISWEETKTYCDWAGMRLPTEAEWEKSARGTSERKYPWGNENPDVGNQYDKCNYKTLDQTGSSTTKAFKKEKDKYIYTSPVDSFSRGASPYGVFNMAGNVNEWCADWLNVDYYSQSPERNPTGPDSGQARVVRGGCWDDISISHLKTTERGSCKPDTRKYILGFRTAK